MARLSEKYNDSVIKMFKLLTLLLHGEADFKDVIEIFADENDGVIQNSHVILNKYLNTLKIFGIKITKQKNKYYLLNMPFNVDFTEDDVRAVEILKASAPLMPAGKVRKNLLNFIKDIEIRYDEKARVASNEFAGKSYIDLSFYFAKCRDQILECEKFCADKQKLEIIYLSNGEETSIIASPKEVKYFNRRICFSVYSQFNDQLTEIPIDNIKSIKQLPIVTKNSSHTISVVFALKNRLAKSYKLKDGEYSNGFDKDGNLIVANDAEDLDMLIARLMRYGENCTILSPKFLRDRMLDVISKCIENYD